MGHQDQVVLGDRAARHERCPVAVLSAYEAVRYRVFCSHAAILASILCAGRGLPAHASDIALLRPETWSR